MEITIDSIVIDKDKVSAVVKLESVIEELSKNSRYDLSANIKHKIIEELTEQYLMKNSIDIINNIDIRTITNAVSLSIARKFNESK